jgi:uncharacterized RDD family membrane protein YckC
MGSGFVADWYGLAFSAPLTLAIWWAYRQKSFPADLKYRTFWPRVWERWVDALVLWPLGFSLDLLLLVDWPRWFVAAIVVVWTLAPPIYTIFMHATFGQTVGKMVTGVRVLDARTEQRISYRQAVMRDGLPCLLGLGALYDLVADILAGRADRFGTPISADLSTLATVDLILQLGWLFVELATMLTNSKRRALHDFIGGTVVVRTNLDVERVPKPSADDGDASSPRSTLVEA